MCACCRNKATAAFDLKAGRGGIISHCSFASFHVCEYEAAHTKDSYCYCISSPAAVVECLLQESSLLSIWAIENKLYFLPRRTFPRFNGRSMKHCQSRSCWVMEEKDTFCSPILFSLFPRGIAMEIAPKSESMYVEFM